jgi:biotin carboxylase
MKLLILQRIPYHKIDYHRGVDHELHEVTYLGEAAALATLPRDLRCNTIPCTELTFAACSSALRVAASKGFDRLIAMSEFDLLLAAELRAALSIVGPRPSAVQLVRDKVQMKAAVKAAGLAVPRHVRADQLDAIDWWGPSILKPIAGAASEGVSRYDSTQAAVQALGSIAEEERSAWELEHYVEGAIHHFDGLVADGNLVTLVASRYVGTCLAYAEGKPLGSVQIPLEEISETMGVAAWVQRCLDAVRLRDGSFHLEAIATAEGLVFLEVGARVGGADVVACTELATGIHLPSVELSLMVGGRVPSACKSQVSYGWFVFPSHHLASERYRVIGADKFSADPCVIKWHARHSRPHASRRISYQAVEAPLAGIVAAPTSRELERFLAELFQHTRVVELDDASTSMEKLSA